MTAKKVLLGCLVLFVLFSCAVVGGGYLLFSSLFERAPLTPPPAAKGVAVRAEDDPLARVTEKLEKAFKAGQDKDTLVAVTFTADEINAALQNAVRPENAAALPNANPDIAWNACFENGAFSVGLSRKQGEGGLFGNYLNARFSLGLAIRDHKLNIDIRSARIGRYNAPPSLFQSYASEISAATLRENGDKDEMAPAILDAIKDLETDSERVVLKFYPKRLDGLLERVGKAFPRPVAPPKQ